VKNLLASPSMHPMSTLPLASNQARSQEGSRPKSRWLESSATGGTKLGSRGTTEPVNRIRSSSIMPSQQWGAAPPSQPAHQSEPSPGLLSSRVIMTQPQIFIDGHAGTTGLRIREWLAGRDDLALFTLADSERKSEEARKKAIAESDLTVLCLPDTAAIEAGRWAGESGARLIDASSSHRVAKGWVYGLPELTPDHRDAIAKAQLVSNPGCYPSGFLTLVRPLIDAKLLSSNALITIHGLSGYSGGGKALIERWESPAEGRVGLPFEAPYALGKIHKHMPEMQTYARLEHPPQFIPAVGPFACGMRIEVPIHRNFLASGTTGTTAHQVLAERYQGEPFVEVAEYRGLEPVDDFSLDPRAVNDTNRMRLHVLPNADGHLLLVAVLDNLGKGASGVAIQSLNLMLGLGETTGLPA
jgi:N-acetyl-gamma-glutamyl-phosphate reductase